MQVVVRGGEDMIVGVPAGELLGPGVYEVEDGHVAGFQPLPAPPGDDIPVGTPGGDSGSAGNGTGIPIADTQQATGLPTPQGDSGTVANTLG